MTLTKAVVSDALKKPEYHKIQTVWLRDPETKFRTLLEGKWAKPEFGYLAELNWTWTEKVDGTNIRLMIGQDGGDVGGKTDEAQIHTGLLARCLEIVTEAALHALNGLTLYGEGHGAGIQKGGGNYSPTKDFVLFDVLSADGMWLERADVEDIAQKVGIGVVPIMGAGPLSAAIGMVRSGGPISAWGSFAAEGLVMRPQTELRNRRGERVIAKIKRRDFDG